MERYFNTEGLCEPDKHYMKPIAGLLDGNEDIVLTELFTRLSSVCEKAPKPIVMMIDEADSASNN